MDHSVQSLLEENGRLSEELAQCKVTLVTLRETMQPGMQWFIVWLHVNCHICTVIMLAPPPSSPPCFCLHIYLRIPFILYSLRIVARSMGSLVGGLSKLTD